MIPRQAAHTAQRLAQGFPVLLITGPRQSGKTTLARVSELIKQRYNQGQPAGLSFWRNNTGQEVDALFEEGTGLRAVEIKF